MLLFNKIYNKSTDLQGRIAEIAPPRVNEYDDRSVHSDDSFFKANKYALDLGGLSLIEVHDARLGQYASLRDQAFEIDRKELCNAQSKGLGPLEVKMMQIKEMESQ